MRTFEGPLVAYIKVLTEDRAALEAQRASRRERYNSSVEGLVAGWREASGYKLGPMMNDQALRRQFSCMVAVVGRASAAGARAGDIASGPGHRAFAAPSCHLRFSIRQRAGALRTETTRHLSTTDQGLRTWPNETMSGCPSSSSDGT